MLTEYKFLCMERYWPTEMWLSVTITWKYILSMKFTIKRKNQNKIELKLQFLTRAVYSKRFKKRCHSSYRETEEGLLEAISFTIFKNLNVGRLRLAESLSVIQFPRGIFGSHWRYEILSYKFMNFFFMTNSEVLSFFWHILNYRSYRVE